MANALYPKGKEKILSAAINFSADTIKAVLVPSGYVYSAAHEFLTSLGGVLGTAQALTSKTVTDGAFDAADPTFAALAAGATVKAVVLYKDTGVAGTSPLLVYIDNLTGFPFTTNGSTLTIEWDNGAFKIFSL